ncbi:MAG: ribose-phosphate pyrophosphokinase [Gammaproteobacteria bacterium]|jgi:ribose-phosphate pyrophosphokinase|nr:ribose-phosphate pyrophosphokinase [Gammaproteobacteria bacterium]MBQ08625.1 ribose-phosphate pyrophosphokinase [Gammaproteobacteria bacterium]MDP6146749.1 ribose-phosphate pyrophosphokinase [Gammaproteobacteria bacterium]HJL79826.1 ribose-phosphate pyrophosphokinase [Gammaproteobacteria bacterium]HJM09370.1 ribose-phosphate pyrophosphokinase [Gammaproteobacteria bacterium]|tara:strand:+ start:5855 stop:6808 length:954 start_codon:yes stop_codon:yes gene_type:complete
MKKEKLVLFAGPASKELGSQIARYLNEPLGFIQVGTFSDGETSIEVSQNIRGMDVFLVQSTYQPGNEHLMQLLLMADACKRASANSVSAVIPYFGYSRQDRRPRNTRGPVSAKLVADLIETADIKRLITVDLHADQIEGFFSIPVDNIYSSTILMSDMWRQGYPDQVIVSPDVGGVQRARAIARRLGNASLAIIDKRREAANKSEVMNIIGDVDQKTAIIFDDMVDTAGTLCNAAAALKEKGALKTVAYAAHPVLSGPAIKRIADSELDELVVTDTIPLTQEAKDTGKIRQLTISQLLGETIERIVADQSVSSLYAE